MTVREARRGARRALQIFFLGKALFMSAMIAVSFLPAPEAALGMLLVGGILAMLIGFVLVMNAVDRADHIQARTRLSH